MIVQVEWEFWTNSNDMCGAVCDVQREFIKVGSCFVNSSVRPNAGLLTGAPKPSEAPTQPMTLLRSPLTFLDGCWELLRWQAEACSGCYAYQLAGERHQRLQDVEHRARRIAMLDGSWL